LELLLVLGDMGHAGTDLPLELGVGVGQIVGEERQGVLLNHFLSEVFIVFGDFS
jgi:hypothetical protein